MTYIVWFCKTLYQVESVVWTSITTSRDSRVVMRLAHTTGKTWYKMLYQHTMHVIRLSNISIETNFKQITKVEIRLIALYNTLVETTFCAWRHVIFAVHSFALLTLLTLTFLPRIPMKWRHGKIVRQRRSRTTSRHSFITSVGWYHILYHIPCIRQATSFKFKGKRIYCFKIYDVYLGFGLGTIDPYINLNKSQ